MHKSSRVFTWLKGESKNLKYPFLNTAVGRFDIFLPLYGQDISTRKIKLVNVMDDL